MLTIKSLADLAGISTRTLRYYDEIGLLKAQNHTPAGYRLYNQQDVDRLQQILIYKAMDMPLDSIKTLLDDPLHEPEAMLKSHRDKLQQEVKRISDLIQYLDQTLNHMKGGYMTNKEKFEGLKQQMLQENEDKYGEEAKALFGEAYLQANDKFKKMSKESFDQQEKLTAKMHEMFINAMMKDDVEMAKEAVQLHKKWLMKYWVSYKKEAHLGLVNMYVQDERFTKYYDNIYIGLAKFIRDSVVKYLD